MISEYIYEYCSVYDARSNIAEKTSTRVYVAACVMDRTYVPKCRLHHLHGLKSLTLSIIRFFLPDFIPLNLVHPTTAANYSYLAT